jgi:DNA-binding response OmpR family regulator
MDRKKILIVDDEETFAHIVKMNLEQTGTYEVGVETDSTKAVAGAAAYRPDLILLDIMMPRRDGFQVLEELKKNHETASIPVLMLSSLSDDDAKRKAAAQYSEGYVEKPVAAGELRAKIEEILKRR